MSQMTDQGQLLQFYQWQPIETAPKDGSRILCWAGWGPCFLVWKTRRGMTGDAGSYFGDPDESDDYDFFKARPPTHWMPLSQPPVERAAK